MQEHPKDKPGFIRSLKRELQYYRNSGRECLLAVIILSASMIIVAWIFSSGTLTNLPIAVIDNDASSVSRTYIRMLNASPEMHIVDKLTSTTEGRELLEQGSIYALVLIPEGFGKDIKKAKQTTILAWHSGQYLTISGTILKSLRLITASMSAGVEMTSLAKRGASGLAASVQFSPLQTELRTLFNPFQNYQYFLVASLLPAMLQVFVMVWTVFVIGKEFRDQTSVEWLASGGSIYCTLAAKVLPVFMLASMIGIACLIWLFGIAGWPVTGSLTLLVVGWELMICAYIVLGLLFVALTKVLATALSLTVFFTAPAFAYAGITFPQHSMPLMAQLWTYLLPIKTLLRLQIEQAEIGAPVSSSMAEILTLLCFILLPLPFAIGRIRRRNETIRIGANCG
ncbi:ABC transporter permease [Paraglaciecola sp. L3A3]|uniref:ABC transporter permease n=1 Tax=Paraglaciecola sp. L3A3 TaxID=2686358 RepID=UPI00131B4929|nr:ABC transporter permease [Paraglaciecola sp. L3A3]